MSNTLTGLIPTIYEARDLVAREQIGFASKVAMDANAETAAVGQTIRSFVSPQGTLADIVPGVTPPNTGGQAFGTVELTISKSKSYPIQWTGEEMKSVSGQYAAMLRSQFAQAFRTLSNAVEADIAAEAVAAAGHVAGTVGTTPFGVANDLSDGAAVRKLLEDAGAPMTGLSLVVDSATMANFRGKQSVLFKANEAGTDELLRKGIIGELHGMAIGQSAGLTSDNIGFYKDALLLAARAPAMPAGGDSATDVMTVTDPVSGLTFQVALYRGYRQIHIEVGLAWGVKCVKPEFVVNLQG